MTGYKAEDVVGKASCRILQGQESSRKSIDDLMSEVRFKRPAAAVLLNYTKQGKMFRNFLNVYPLSTDSKITHYVALTEHSDQLDSVPDQATAAVQMTYQPLRIHKCPKYSSYWSCGESTNPGGAQPSATGHASLRQQVMLQGQSNLVPGAMALPMSGGPQLVYYHQAQPGILPKPSVGMPVLQTMK
jgi:hypothetical protein